MTPLRRLGTLRYLALADLRCRPCADVHAERQLVHAALQRGEPLSTILSGG
jgi:hypothetical protein